LIDNHNVFFEPKASGDFSKEASNSKPERKMMGKIAMLETQVFAMQKRIKELEIEKQVDQNEINKLQFIQTKIDIHEEKEF
jgi:hypothetical protein